MKVSASSAVSAPKKIALFVAAFTLGTVSSDIASHYDFQSILHQAPSHNSSNSSSDSNIPQNSRVGRAKKH